MTEVRVRKKKFCNFLFFVQEKCICIFMRERKKEKKKNTCPEWSVEEMSVIMCYVRLLTRQFPQ